MQPKVFISYSWSSPGHQARIRLWGEQLMNDGIDVILDIWDLREGDDKYAFMERMVNDESVTYVLIFSDSEYAAKADAREAGVGTESQIISHKIYSQVKDSKFIPIACEFDDSGEPFLPVFLTSRIWIDFSSPEAVNNNWEQLIRALYGKPAYEKPLLGKTPGYITANIHIPASPAFAKFVAFKQALLYEKTGLKLYREDFLFTCYEYVNILRIRERPDINNIGQRALEDCGKLKIVRDHLVDWILLESATKPSEEFDETLIAMLEQLLELKSRPAELHSWNDAWFDAHRVFVYETFLYIVAALLKTGSFRSLRLLLTSHYLLPETESSGGDRFTEFDAFYGYSDALQILASEGKRLFAPAAELIKRQADRTDVPFREIMQAELLILLMTFIVTGPRWYPQTLHYSQHSREFPFFIRATRHRDFQKLAKITGISSGDELRTMVRAGQERLGINRWSDFWMSDRKFWNDMNMEKLDTLV